MTHEEVWALSARLVELGQSHTVTVGVHDELNPRVNCRIQLHIPPGGITLERLNRLELDTAYEVELSFLDNGIYLRKPR
jgi:hypothetical protein